LHEVLYYLGNCYLRLDDVDEAIKYYIKSLKYNKNNAEGYYNLGNSLCIKTKYKEAIKCYKKSIALDSKKNETHFNLANTYFSDKQYDESLKSYENCKNYAEKKNQILFMQARIYIELEDPSNYSKASKIFEFLTSIENYKNDINVMYYRAILMEKMNNIDRAVYLYKVS